MTTSTDAAKEIVVEQCDRDLATHIVSISRGYGVKLPDDGHYAIQAAARHRIAEMERVVAWLREEGARLRDEDNEGWAHDSITWRAAEIGVFFACAKALERGDHNTTGQEEGA